MCETLTKIVWSQGAFAKDEIILTQLRHKEAIVQAHEALEQLHIGLCEKRSPELLTSDMRASLMSLGRIIGTNISDDILSSIFSTFCIGK